MSGRSISESLHWAYKKWNATVLNDIWPEMWFFGTVSLAVCLVNKYTNVDFTVPTGMLTVLGTVLGLVISFRTTSAYDRYWEGRKLWGNIALASRNLSMIIWMHVPLKRKPKEGESTEDIQLRALIERKSMLNLVQAFSVAVKHYLRSEPGIYYEDLYPLLSFLPQSVDGEHSEDNDKLDRGSSLPMWHAGSTGSRSSSRRKKHDFDPEKVLPDVSHSNIPLHPARNPPKDTIYDIFPPFIIFAPIHVLIKKLFGRRRGEEEGSRNWLGKKKEAEPITSNIPLEITLFLSSYLAVLQVHGHLTPATATGYLNALTSMQDAVTNLERIRTTPIPFAYQFHLRISVWLYLIFLPLQIYETFKWITIPAVVFAAFLYLGFLEIGQEIENPFNYDANDLDLDSFCIQIQRELSEITAHPAPDPSTFIFSQWNQPFAPADRRNAAQILHDRRQAGHEDGAAVHQVRSTLLENYLQISEATTHHHRRRQIPVDPQP